MANKVYNKKGKVHPSLPVADDHLSLFLPAAILALAASLPLHDKELLAYFLSCPGSGGVDLRDASGRANHAPEFECACFRCYVSFWSRWDSSPNRDVIDKIIESFEEHERREAMAVSRRRVRQGRSGRKEWKKRGGAKDDIDGALAKGGGSTMEAAEEGSSEEETGEAERGLVRRIGTTIGFKIWNFLDRITM